MASQSDLIPVNIVLASSSVAPGASLPVSWTLANQGIGAANSTSTTELRINQSTTSFAGTDLLGVATSALAGQTSVAQSGTLTAPTTPGTYYVWVIADDFSKVTNQSSTSNDAQHSVAFTVTAPPTQSDLVPTSIVLGSTTLAPGASLPVSWTLANQGTGAANSTSTTELRITQSSTSFAGTDLLGVATSALAGQTSVAQSGTLTAPTTPGTYYVWVIADDFSKVTNQSSTSNDAQHSVAFTVTAPPTQSDLVPTSIVLGSTTVAPGASFGVSWTLANQGAGAANSTSTTELRINQSSTSFGGSDLLGVATSALAGQTSVAQSGFLTAPTTPGTYYVWVIADDFSKVTNQSSTSNDAQHSVAFTVAGTLNSDLIPRSMVLGASTVAPGNTVGVSWTLANEGAGTATATRTGVRVTTSSTDHGTAVNDVASYNTPALGSQASDAEFATFTAPTTPGTYYVWVVADNSNPATGNQGSNTANDFQLAGSFTVSSQTNYTVSAAPNPVSENSGQVTFTINRSGALPDETIYASTIQNVNGSGVYNINDYATNVNNLPVHFAAGAQTASVPLSIINDAVPEHDETFGFIVQRNATDPVSVSLANTTFTIHDDDNGSVTQYQVTADNRVVQNTSGATINFNVTRSGDLPAETIYASTLAGTGGWSQNTGLFDDINNQILSFAQGAVTSTPLTIRLAGNTLSQRFSNFGLLIQRAFGAAAESLAATNFSLIPVAEAATVPGPPTLRLPFSYNQIHSVLINQQFGEGRDDPYGLHGFLRGPNDHGATINPLFDADPYLYYAIDFGVTNRTDVLSQGTGHVVETRRTAQLGEDTPDHFGNYVTVAYDRPGGGTFYATYMHMSPESMIADHASVSLGQFIGYSGDTGTLDSAGLSHPHLHVTYGNSLTYYHQQVHMADGSLGGPNVNGPPVRFYDGELLNDGVRRPVDNEIGDQVTLDPTTPHTASGSGPLSTVTFLSDPANTPQLSLNAQGPLAVVTNLDTGKVIAQIQNYGEAALNSVRRLVVGLLNGTDILGHTVYFHGADGGSSLDASATDTTVVASGGTGNDTLIGGPLGDTLDGGPGTDTLTGGPGGDTFVFAPGDAADTIADFTPSQGDTIDLTAFTSIHTLAQVLSHASQVGPDTVLNFGNGDTLTLAGIASASLTSSTAFILTPAHFAFREDFNADGRADILWRNDRTGDTYLWNSNAGAGTFTGQDIGAVSGEWVIQQAADFNRDGHADILWRNATTGDSYLWNSNGGAGTFTGQDIGAVAWTWTIQQAADFNGDGYSDILWRNTTTGDTYLWNSNGGAGTFTGQDIGAVAWTWTIQQAADFNGDGYSDILWRNTTTGDAYLWNSNGSGGFAGEDIGAVSMEWAIQQAGDFNSDGRADILWRNTTNGDTYLWNSAAGSGAPSFAGQDLGAISWEWRIVG